MRDKWGRIVNGSRVVVEHDHSFDREYSEGRPSAKKIALGLVLGHSDSHGLCYHVRHEDGTKCWYEPEEVKEI